mgnify:CR=1 FL=1
MQPNDPYQSNQLPQAGAQQPQVPSDYLNTIAAPTPVKTLNPMILWGLIGGLLILAIVAIIGVSSSIGGNPTSSLASVGARLDGLRTQSEAGQKNIQSSQLRTLNSSLTLVLTNANRDFAAPLKAQEINLKDNKNESILAVRNDFTEVEKRLEDARLNGVYDRTYAREMTYALKTLNSDMATLYNSTRSAALKKILDDTQKTLTPLVIEFSSFNG